MSIRIAGRELRPGDRENDYPQNLARFIGVARSDARRVR